MIEKENKEIIEDYNEFPFTKALRLDKRNIFIILKSVLELFYNLP